MATVQEMLTAKGVQPSPSGRKEARKASGTTTVPPSFAFYKAPPIVPKVVAVKTPEERQKAAEAFRQFRKDVVIAMHDCVRGVCAIDAIQDEDERTMEVPHRKELYDNIELMLSYDESTYRELAVLAYADALVSTCSADFTDDAKDVLEELVRVNFLKQVAGSGERIFGKNYGLAAGFAKNSEAKAVGMKLSQLVNRITAAYNKRYQEDLTAIKAAVGGLPLTAADLKAGKDGRILLPTPDHEYRDRNGKDHTYRGGFLLLESVGGKITIINGVGGCQHIAQKLAATGAFIWNTLLSSERLELKERLPEEAFLNVRILHGLIYRGVIAAEKAREREEAIDKRKAEFKEQTAGERENLKALATLTPVEAFLFEKSGMTVLDPLGRMPFEIHSQRNGEKPTLAWDVVALVEFTERDGRRYVRVADCPERLNSFFANFREFVPTGEKFSAVKWPFVVLLKMGYKSAFAEATPEQKTAVETKRAEAEAAHKAAKVQADQKLAEQLAAGIGEDVSGTQIPDPTEGRS